MFERRVTIADESFNLLESEGSGPLLHLAHANGLCAGAYQPLLELLATRFRVTAWDARGHGATSARAHPEALHDWEPYVQDLTALCDQLVQKAGAPLVLAGHSLGGVLSLLVAVRRPELVRALVLIDPTIFARRLGILWGLAKRLGQGSRIPLVATSLNRRRVWESRTAVLASWREKPVFATWQPGFLDGYVTFGTRELPDGRVELACDPTWEARSFTVTPHDLWRDVAALRVATLVIYGDRSNTFLHAAARRFARLQPAARMVAVAGASHFVPMEHPQQVADEIAGFIAAMS
jgi:pimeloyl-ACP methyl ester carboxylesterase